MSLSGNEELKWMVWDKVKWQGEDDDYIDLSNLPKDKNTTVVSLEPQRIRTFRFDYNYHEPIIPTNKTVVTI